ncbi:hypothetical protein MYX77_00890 [Acidobacteriia bacterium AH_259_A11_L15]|nr:hypothetical protein [Acidobacteriia bacterium AH_259_A11_L15]
MKVNHFELIGYREDQLKKVFDSVETGSIETLLNTVERRYDIRNKIIFNDTAWKGYFPVGHALNEISRNIHASFKKQFFRENGVIKGITSDSDFFIRANNTVEEVTLDARKGSLKPGKYILLKYTDLQWRAFYDVFKVVNDNLLIGKVYMGLPFPDGQEMFTFPMVREYVFDEMTVEDHRELYDQLAIAPDSVSLEGTWSMAAVTNSNHRRDVAQLAFAVKPGGRIEGRYLFMRTIQGQMRTDLQPDHLRLIDFTPLHDEIRAIDANYMLGKWVTDKPVPFGPFSAGLLQAESIGPGQSRFGFYYILKRAGAAKLPAPALLEKILNRRLGVGLTFDEQMDGSYYAGDRNVSPKHLRSLDPAKGKKCQFNVKMTIPDLDVFVASNEHRAELTGTIRFEEFRRDRNLVLRLEPSSFFNYLILNPTSEEHEMRYHLRFKHRDSIFVLKGTKFMQKDHKGDIWEILDDYTTLYTQIVEEESGDVQGVALLKFRTFESVAALVSLAQFGLSFDVTGTDNPAIKAAAIAKFNAMTTRFVFDEYNPLGL